MSERTISKAEKEDLVKTFERVLNDFEVVAKSDVENIVEARVADLTKAAEEEDLQDVSHHEAREREAEAASQAAEENHAMTVEQLRDALPPDVWTVVSRHLAAAESPVPDTDIVGMEPDVTKAVNSALTTSGETLRKVRGERAAHQGASEPSYERTEKSGEPISKTLLSPFYDKEPKETVRKSKKGKDTPAGLTAVEEAEDL